MSGKIILPNEGLSRRRVLGLAATSAIGVVVSQSLGGCSTADATSPEADTTGTGGSGSVACVVTAALTEGPYFVDERLNRSDIRADPASGALSQGAPLALRFNVSRVASNACTPLTGAYLDVWHCDAAGVYSDVSGAGSGRRFLRGYQITDANGADFVRSRCATRVEECFDSVELSVAKRFEDAESERLRDRRADTIEHRVEAGDFGPTRADVRLQLVSRVDKRGVGHAFGALEPLRQSEIGLRSSVHTLNLYIGMALPSGS